MAKKYYSNVFGILKNTTNYTSDYMEKHIESELP